MVRVNSRPISAITARHSGKPVWRAVPFYPVRFGFTRSAWSRSHFPPRSPPRKAGPSLFVGSDTNPSAHSGEWASGRDELSNLFRSALTSAFALGRSVRRGRTLPRAVRSSQPLARNPQAYPKDFSVIPSGVTFVNRFPTDARNFNGLRPVFRESSNIF